MRGRGFRGFGVLAVVVNVGLVAAIAVPTIGSVRMSKAFQRGEADVRALLETARESAETSGRTETRVQIEGDRLLVRGGAEDDAPILASIDAKNYVATFIGRNLPVQLDARGHRLNESEPTVTIVNSRIKAARTFAVGRLGLASTFP